MSKRKKEEQGVPEKALKSRKSEESRLETVDTDEREFVANVKTLLRNKATLLSGLNQLRDILKSKEPRSYSVFKEFVRENSECPELYKGLEKGRQEQIPLELQIALEILEHLLLFAAEDPSSYGQIGMYHVRRLLHNHLQLIHSCLNPTCHVNMIKGALRLLVAMVTQGASAARELTAGFDFTLRALGSIVNKRDVKVSEDIRTCFIHFVMSFLMYGDAATIRQVLDIKGFMSSIFKLFPSDSPEVVHLVLTVLHQKIVQNNAVPKKSKVQFFSSVVLTKLASLYNYDKEEDTEQDEDKIDEKQTVSENIHKILQDICCTFKFGICFANKMGMFSPRSNNPVLLRFLQSLPKHDQDLHLRQLIIQILTCCPDLVQPFLSSQSTTYEPRLSLPWLSNINFIIQLYSALPLPSVMIEKSSISLNKESVQSVLNTVFPSVLTRTNLNQGIQHANLLVKNTSLLMLVLIMKRANNLLDFCEKERPSTKEELFPSGQSFVEMFRDSLIKCLPDIMTIISLRQNLVAVKQLRDNSKKSEDCEDNAMEDDSHTSDKEGSPTLLLARVLQVLYHYQKVQPLIFSTTAFDLGKLLPGQHDEIDRIFPPIVQHYTLEILSDLPRGVFKWHQQKSKNGPSHMYSVLKLFVLSSSGKIRSKAKNLIVKFLQDTGIIAQDIKEVGTWLKHINTSTFQHDQEDLLVFLDSVCHSVAMEPYTYTDVVMEMMSEAKACQADREDFSVLTSVDDTLQRGSFTLRAAFSPLIVRALMAHVKMVSSTQDTHKNNQLCSVARYINLVILDVLTEMVNPLPLILTVKRFYGNKALSVDCVSLKTTHQSLLRYVDKWIGDPTSLKDEETQVKDETSIALKAFLESQGSNPSQECLTSFLGDLNESRLQIAIGPCVQLCMSKFAGNLRPIVNQLLVKPYCIIGATTEEILPLLNDLPFANLLWQILSPLLTTFNFNNDTLVSEEMPQSLRENKEYVHAALLVQHPGIQASIVDALEREDLSNFPRLSNYLLQYLSAFVSKATILINKDRFDHCQDNYSNSQGTDRVRGKGEMKKQQGNETADQETQNFVMSVFSLVFQLVESMVEKIDQAVNSCGKNISKSENEKSKLSSGRNIALSDSLEFDSCNNKDKDNDSKHIKEMFLTTLLQNPVLLSCFLLDVDNKDHRLSPDICRGLTFCIGDLLRGIIERNQSGFLQNLLKYFTRKVCDKAVDVVTKAMVNNGISTDGQALQVLHLLQVFSPFSDQESLTKPIVKLLELPFETLVKKSQNRLEPTIYYQTLLALLDSQPSHVTSMSNQETLMGGVFKGPGQLTSLVNRGSPFVDIDTMSSHVTSVSNQKEALLSAADFVKVTKLLREVPCLQLDRVILKFLRTTPRYLLEVDFDFLDHCLDNITEDSVAISTMLIASSACLRVHFEQRCTSRCQDGVVQQLDLKDHLWDLLPVVHWYFSYAESIGALSSENKVLSYLTENYWPTLWDWIREPKRNTNRTQVAQQDLSCAVLKFLIIVKSRDTKDSKKLFSKLLDLIPSQSWDVHQMSITITMLDLLLKNSTDEYKQSVLVGTTVSVCMVNLSLMLQISSEDNSLINTALSMLLDIVTTHTDCILRGDDSLVEVEAWSTFVKNCLKYRYDCTMTLQCMTACVKPLYNSTKHKTLTREFPLTTMYQLILSHSKFLEIMLEGDEGNVKLKESLLDLVIAIAELCPECCASSHLPVFLGSYAASLSKTDQSVLHLLHLYERAQVSLSSFRPYLWGKAALEHHKVKKIQGPSLWQQPSTNEVLELLDVTTLNRSAHDFPLERKLKPRVQSDLVSAPDNLSSLYDPCFLIPLFGHLLSQNSVVDCRKFVDRGGLGYTVAALSSRDAHMRRAAHHVLSRCWMHMEAASFREKKQINLLLESLKNGIADVNARVSSVITRFVSRAAHTMLYPENQMYVLVNSFLLQRSVMDLREAPLFYTLFNSSSLQHRSERVWILQLLVEGLRDTQDYFVYKKRHIIKLAMSYHDSQMSDQQSRKLVVSLVTAALSIHSPAFDLTKNYAIIGWIHSLCLTSPSDGERLSTSLRLLHTLWFTIKRGKPGACNEVDSGNAANSTPYPPNLSEESLLVCKTMIKLYSSGGAILVDLPMLLELLSSILGRLGETSPQRSRVTHQEVHQLITLWCMLFNEHQVLSSLVKEVQLAEQKSGSKTSDEQETETEKLKSLNFLLDIIVQWRPTLTFESESTAETTVVAVVLLACNFGFHFTSNSDQDADGSDLSLLDVVTWFRYCLASNASLQKALLGHVGEPCLKRLIYLLGFANGAINSLVQELNMIFLVLASRVGHVQSDVLGSSAIEIAELLSSDVYQEVMTSGVVEVLLPLCPSPLADKKIEDIDYKVTGLLSVFVRDLWYGQHVPSHFLSLVSTNKNAMSSKLSTVFKGGSAKLQKLMH